MRKCVNTRIEKKGEQFYEDGDIWQKMNDVLTDNLPVMDISLEYCDEEYMSYGIDVTSEQKLVCLFFTGDSCYFPGIWIGNDDVELLDSMPIYIIDMEDDDTVSKCVGNFRSYIESLLDAFLLEYDKKDDEYYETALLLKEKIKEFSSETIDKGDYTLKSINN